MKKIIISTLICIVLVSCKEEPNHVYEQEAPLITKTYLCDFPYAKNIDEINVVQIGECEYLVSNAHPLEDMTITHKGDCKFCLIRQEDMIRKILLEK
jgi:hypothetical protein